MALSTDLVTAFHRFKYMYEHFFLFHFAQPHGGGARAVQ
jgi:hypothetical protein